MAALSDVDLLMIGKTGNGKSALGNAILKRKSFEADFSFESVTTESNYEFAQYKSRVMKIVDGPGVGDTRLNTSDAVKLVVKAMEAAMVANTRGYHAFLLVVKFGGRFTAEDKDTVHFLKTIFGGDDFVRRYCILVMTYGDVFEQQRVREGGGSEDLSQWCHNQGHGGNGAFHEWCQRQRGVFKDLLHEVDNRIVLFDNATKDEDKRNAQIDRLLQLVDGLQYQGVRYRDANFQQAQTARNRAVVESGKPEIQEEVLQETSLILQMLDEIRNKFQDADQISPLERLLARCNTFHMGLKEKDKGTGALHDLEESVSAVQHSITDAIRAQNIVLEERRKLENMEKQMRDQMEEGLRKQREEFDELIKQQKKTEEDRRQMEKELAEKREQLEEERRRERDAKEKELVELLQRERLLLEQKTQELQNAYKENKRKSKGGWFAKTVGFIANNLPVIGGFLGKLMKK